MTGNWQKTSGQGSKVMSKVNATDQHEADTGIKEIPSE